MPQARCLLVTVWKTHLMVNRLYAIHKYSGNSSMQTLKWGLLLIMDICLGPGDLLENNTLSSLKNAYSGHLEAATFKISCYKLS